MCIRDRDYLKTGIGLRGFGQRDPLVEYKTEAYGAFQILVDTMYEDYPVSYTHLSILPRATTRSWAKASNPGPSWETERPMTVSYTHLDVYKRQA